MTQTGEYRIETDAGRKLVRVKLIGFWDEAVANAFAVDEQAAVRTVARHSGEHLTLADLGEFNLQSQVVVKICQNLIEHAELKSRKLAVVSGDGLARIQIKRILLRDTMRVFSSVPEAEEWLFAAA
jgi:hypothetical protein